MTGDLQVACIDCTKYNPGQDGDKILALACHSAYLSIVYFCSVRLGCAFHSQQEYVLFPHNIFRHWCDGRTWRAGFHSRKSSVGFLRYQASQTWLRTPRRHPKCGPRESPEVNLAATKAFNHVRGRLPSLSTCSNSVWNQDDNIYRSFPTLKAAKQWFTSRCGLLGKCESYGMPSSHAQVFGYALAVHLILRYAANKPRRSLQGRITSAETIFLSTIFTIVAFARVHLGYHTVFQTTIGGWLGLAFGLIWTQTVVLRVKKNERRILEQWPLLAALGCMLEVEPETEQERKHI